MWIARCQKLHPRYPFPENMGQTRELCLYISRRITHWLGEYYFKPPPLSVTLNPLHSSRYKFRSTLEMLALHHLLCLVCSFWKYHQKTGINLGALILLGISDVLLMQRDQQLDSTLGLHGLVFQALMIKRLMSLSHESLQKHLSHKMWLCRKILSHKNSREISCTQSVNGEAAFYV